MMTSPQKKIARAGLLLFVCASLGYFILGEMRVDPADAPVEPIPENAKLIVYYLSQGKECTTCENIEAFTRAALDEHYAVEIASGEIVLRTHDMDEARHKHFVTDFNLFTKSIVLVALQEGETIRYENLVDIWDYVYNKDEFVAFIRDNIDRFLGEGA